MKTIRLIWQCEDCKDVVISYSRLSHDMNYCECGKSAVDIDEFTQGNRGKVKEISRKKILNGKWVNVTKKN